MFDSQKNAFYFAFQINVLFQRCTILWTILSRTKKRFTLISCKHTYSARAVSKHFQFDTKQQQQQQNKITIIAETEFEFIRLCCHSTESLFYYKQKTICAKSSEQRKRERGVENSCRAARTLQSVDTTHILQNMRKFSVDISNHFPSTQCK